MYKTKICTLYSKSTGNRVVYSFDFCAFGLIESSSKLTQKSDNCNNSDFLIPLSVQPIEIDLKYLKLNSLRSNNLSLKYQRFTPS